MSKRVAVVTGGNKGIGLAIVKSLCKHFKGDVILTARSEERGKAAVEGLKNEGLSPLFHPLDIDSVPSIDRVRNYLQQSYGGLDVLVNNAGILYKNDSNAPFEEQAEVTVKTNFTGTLNVSKALLPLLRPHARVVNVSSIMTLVALQKSSPDLQKRLTNLPMTIQQVEDLMAEFVSSVKAGNHKAKGWPDTAYGSSKIGVLLMTFAQHQELSKLDDVIINCCCPGHVATDMSSFKGHKTVDEGADTPVYLAMLPPNVESPRGEFVWDRTVKKWAVIYDDYREILLSTVW